MQYFAQKVPIMCYLLCKLRSCTISLFCTKSQWYACAAMSLQKSPPTQSLTFWDRHPILKQASEDALDLSIQQVALPMVGTSSTLFIAWWLGQIISWRGALVPIMGSLAVGLLLYILIALIRAPFVVIGRQRSQLYEIAHQVLELGQKVRTAEQARLDQQTQIAELNKKVEQAALGTYASPQPLEGFELKKLEPNVVWSMPRLVDAYRRSNDGVIFVGGVRGSDEGENLRAVVAPIENFLPPNKTIVRVRNVSARVFYKFFDKSSSFEINRGTWLSKGQCTVNFEVNDRHELVVATIEEGNRLFVNRCDGSKVVKDSELIQDIISINVRLIAESESRTLRTFAYILEVTRQPEFKAELHWAYVWKVNRLHDYRVQGFGLTMKYHTIWKEAHEKFEVIGDYWNAEVLAWKKTQEEGLAEQVKSWEAATAAFIETYLGEKQKKDFLGSYPSIEDGLNEKYRLTLRPPNAPKPTTPDPTHWDLNDSISARTNKLSAFIDELVRVG